MNLFNSLKESKREATEQLLELGNQDTIDEVAIIAAASEADEIPEQYKYPITLELMEDPVITSDGHSYERIEIENWLETQTMSPLTGTLMESTQLIPNIALRQLIQEWEQNH